MHKINTKRFGEDPAGVKSVKTASGRILRPGIIGNGVEEDSAAKRLHSAQEVLRRNW